MTPAARLSPCRALSVASIATALLAHSAAQAQSAEVIAEELYLQGKALMAAGDVDGACDRFARSQKVQAALGTLLNLAVCHEKQGKTASAWAEFAEAEAIAKRTGDAQRAELARTRLTALATTVPHLLVEITSPPPGLRATLDGTDLPREAWGTAIPIDPGEHQLEVTAEGRVPFLRKMRLEPNGSTERIQVTLESPPAATPVHVPTLAPTRDPARSPDAQSKRTTGIDPRWVGGWTSVGAGVVGLGAAVGVGVVMASNVSRRDQLCPPGTPCTVQDAFTADHAARVDRLAMFVSGGIGLAALGAGVGLLLVSRRDASSASRVELTSVVSPTHTGLGLRGNF